MQMITLECDKPRERLLTYGAAQLTNQELLSYYWQRCSRRKCLYGGTALTGTYRSYWRLKIYDISGADYN